MKKIYSICIFLFLAFTGQQVVAQQIGDLKGIHFQAVAIDDMGKEIVGMDINGKPVYKKTIGVKFSILKGNGGPVLYQETHETLTDQHGLFSLVIGEGTKSSAGAHSTLMEIPWIDADQFLKVEVAIKNDGNYKMVSLQQFMAVPYSFYTDDIADDAITTAKILNEEILSEDIKEGAVETSEILNETILAEDIAEGAVTTSEILNGTIINEDIAADAVTSGKIQDGTIVNADIANATVDLTAKVTSVLPVANGGTGVNGSSAVDGQLLIGNGTNNNFDLANLTAGSGIQIRNTPGGIEILSTVTGIDAAISASNISPGRISDGDSWVSPKIPVTNAEFGDMVIASVNADLQGCQLTAHVAESGKVQIVISNNSGIDVSFAPMSPKVLVIN